jgi:type IV secretory pathway VirB2 component (pilin)
MRATAQSALFVLGVCALALGSTFDGLAQLDALQIEYNDQRFAEAANAILSYLEGSFGALVMVVAGLIAIISAAFGQYRAAMGCLIIAVGAFVLRSFVSTFFNDGNIMD